MSMSVSVFCVGEDLRAMTVLMVPNVTDWDVTFSRRYLVISTGGVSNLPIIVVQSAKVPN